MAKDYLFPYKTHMEANKGKSYIVYITLGTWCGLCDYTFTTRAAVREHTQGKHGEYQSVSERSYQVWCNTEATLKKLFIWWVFRSAVQLDWLKNTELRMNVASMLEGFVLLMLFIIMAAFMYFVARWFLELINNHFRKGDPENDVKFKFPFKWFKLTFFSGRANRNDYNQVKRSDVFSVMITIINRLKFRIFHKSR